MRRHNRPLLRCPYDQCTVYTRASFFFLSRSPSLYWLERLDNTSSPSSFSRLTANGHNHIRSNDSETEQTTHPARSPFIRHDGHRSPFRLACAHARLLDSHWPDETMRTMRSSQMPHGNTLTRPDQSLDTSLVDFLDVGQRMSRWTNTRSMWLLSSVRSTRGLHTVHTVRSFSCTSI